MRGIYFETFLCKLQQTCWELFTLINYQDKQNISLQDETSLYSTLGTRCKRHSTNEMPLSFKTSSKARLRFSCNKLTISSAHSARPPPRSLHHLQNVLGQRCTESLRWDYIFVFFKKWTNLFRFIFVFLTSHNLNSNLNW